MGLAVVIWSYPRGGDITKDGETAMDVAAYAAHIAALMGAHEMAHVRRGDVVVTAGGIVGKVTKVLESEEVMVELADNVTVKVVKSTLSDVRTKPQPPANDQ